MAVITYLEAIRQALFDEMGRDERVFVIGEDVGAYGGAFKVTEGLIDKFGEKRVIDTPISEAAIVGSAIGASYMGMRPVCEIQFIDFIACCFDMLTNFAATSRTETARACRSSCAVRPAAASAADRSTRSTRKRSSSTRPG